MKVKLRKLSTLNHEIKLFEIRVKKKSFLVPVNQFIGYKGTPLIILKAKIGKDI